MLSGGHVFQLIQFAFSYFYRTPRDNFCQIILEFPWADPEFLGFICINEWKFTLLISFHFY